MAFASSTLMTIFLICYGFAFGGPTLSLCLKSWGIASLRFTFMLGNLFCYDFALDGPALGLGFKISDWS